MPRDLRIAIVGGGLGGLTTALALQRAGFRPVILEQAPVLGEVGAGLSITPNAAKGLISLGLGPALAALAETPPHQSVRDAATGRELKRIDRADTPALYGGPYHMMHRADFQTLLVEAVRTTDPDALRLGVAVQAVETAGRGALVRHGDRAERFDLAIAADGVRSRIRAHLLGEEAVRFTGHVAWRGLVPADALAFPVAPGSVTWTGAERSFTRYPVRGGALINYVGLSRTASWRGEGWSQRVPADEALACFAAFPDEVRTLIAATPGGRCHSWGLFDRAPLATYVSGRIALLGDAAHPMLPFLGQGAAMAIEDAVVLGRALAEGDTLADALAAYDRARVPRAGFIQRESAAGADRLQQDRPQGERGLDRGEDALGIFRYDPATVPLR